MLIWIVLLLIVLFVAHNVLNYYFEWYFKKVGGRFYIGTSLKWEDDKKAAYKLARKEAALAEVS